MKKRSVFRDTWKDYFSFSKRERRGIFALLLIILLQLTVLVYLKYASRAPAGDFSEFEKEAQAFYAKIDTSENFSGQLSPDNSQSKKEYAIVNEEKKPELFDFNPNNLSSSDWQRLGFSEKQIRVIKNYEAKGGRFRSKEDVKKMFCISEKEYKRIEDFINIPETKSENLFEGRSETKKYEKTVASLNIGTADSAELTQLRGIGPSFARRIFLYREKLGGFVRLEQLREVWGLSDSLYQSLRPAIYLKDSISVRKLDLNAADPKELGNHPYIGYKLAGVICNYRKQHNFNSIDEIKKIPLVNEELYSKLMPYLEIK